MLGVIAVGCRSANNGDKVGTAEAGKRASGKEQRDADDPPELRKYQMHLHRFVATSASRFSLPAASPMADVHTHCRQREESEHGSSPYGANALGVINDHVAEY